MKKLFALLLALCLLCAAALADAAVIPGTKLSLDYGNAEVYELEPEDEEEGMVLWFGVDEAMECGVYLMDAMGDTMEEIAEGLRVLYADSLINSGMTNINGIDAFFLVESDGEDNFVTYFVLMDDVVVEFTFWYADDAAAQLTGVIMNTLTLAK